MKIGGGEFMNLAEIEVKYAICIIGYGGMDAPGKTQTCK